MERGRPTKFNESLKALMLELYKRGKTDKQVAHIVGVSIRTLHNWKANHPSFLHSLKDAKQIADDLVESSLFQMAINGNHVAAIFWLKNRKPDEWRDKKEVDVRTFKDLTDEQLDAKIQELMNAARTED